MKISANGFVFDAIDVGPRDGPGVLFLHGFPESMYMWEPIFPGLIEQGYRCVAFNQRGYSSGARPNGVEHYAPAALATDVLGVLDAVGWDTAHLVGHDWGAAIAWRVAAMAPERLRTLNVLSVGHPDVIADLIRNNPEHRRRSAYAKRFRDPDSHLHLLADNAAGLRAIYADWTDPVAVERNVSLLSQPGALEAALHWYRASTRGAHTDGAIELPVLYLWSDGDPAMGREVAERTADFVHGPYRLVVLEGVSHWIVQEAPQRVLDELAHHLALHP